MADNVRQLAVSREQITRIIRLIVEKSANVGFTDESSLQEMELVINRNQIFACLRKGEVVTDPECTPEGYVECEMSYFTAGQDVRVAVAVQYDDDRNRFLVVRKIAKE